VAGPAASRGDRVRSFLLAAGRADRNVQISTHEEPIGEDEGP
jgi:hypothetical protein